MNSILRSISLLALCGLLTLETATQAGVKEGNAAYKAGDYVEAINQWTPEAEVGNRSAQFNLGQLHARGRGVEKDEGVALAWFEKSAAQNYAPAQYYAGLIRSRITGAEQDQQKSFAWFQEAAKQDHAAAQYQLAVRYEKGRAVEKDLSRALYWTTRSEAGAKGKLKAKVVKYRAKLISSMSDRQVNQAAEMATAAEKPVDDQAKTVIQQD